MSLILLRFARPKCLPATHLSSPEVGNELSWPKPPCTCNAMVTSQAQHSTNEGVLRSNSSVLNADETTCGCRDEESNPGPPGSETSALPLGHRLEVNDIYLHKFLYKKIFGDKVRQTLMSCAVIIISPWTM